MAWVRVRLAVPVEYGEAANRLASILDPDVGGASTFTEPASVGGVPPATHYIANTLISDGFLPALKDADLALVVLQSRADELGRGYPDPTDVDDFAGNVVVDPSDILPVRNDSG